MNRCGTIQSQTDVTLRAVVSLLTSSDWWTAAAHDPAYSSTAVPQGDINGASYPRFDLILPFMSITTPLANK